MEIRQSDWREIETAPKDGTWILAVDAHKITSGGGPHAGSHALEIVCWYDGQWHINHHWNDETDDVDGLTHWLPMPDNWPSAIPTEPRPPRVPAYTVRMPNFTKIDRRRFYANRTLGIVQRVTIAQSAADGTVFVEADGDDLLFAVNPDDLLHDERDALASLSHP